MALTQRPLCPDREVNALRVMPCGDRVEREWHTQRDLTCRALWRKGLVLFAAYRLETPTTLAAIFAPPCDMTKFSWGAPERLIEMAYYGRATHSALTCFPREISTREGEIANFKGKRYEMNMAKLETFLRPSVRQRELIYAYTYTGLYIGC